MRFVLWFLSPLLAAGCFQQEVINYIANPPVRAAGALTVAIDGGSMRAIPGIAANKVEPMRIEGATPEMTFSLTAGSEASGTTTARTALVEASRSIELLMTEMSGNLLEVHRDGMGCVARTGSVLLATDDAKRIKGEFHVVGVLTGGSETTCVMDGTIDGIPVDGSK